MKHVTTTHGEQRITKDAPATRDRRWSALAFLAALASACVFPSGPEPRPEDEGIRDSFEGGGTVDPTDDGGTSADADARADVTMSNDASDASDGSSDDRPEVLVTADVSGEDRSSGSPDVVRCGGSSAACRVSSDCCEGLSCIGGACGRCDPAGARPQYCAQAGGGCWSADTSCSTVRNCSGALWGCRNPLLTLNCATTRCECPAARPVYCAATGSLPESCWPTGTDCATQESCPRGPVACASGQRVNCGTGTCETLPRWFAGVYYSRVGRTENNVAFSSDNRSLTFRTDGTYSHSLGRSTSTSGNYTVSATQISCTTGALTGTTFSLTSSFRASCRILDGLGSPLWSSSEVTACPTYQRVTATECAYVGTYRRSSESGSISASGSGSTTSTTDTITLYRDHFFTYYSSRTIRTCFQYDCRSLVNRPTTQVGAWSVSGGAAGYSLAALRGAGWTFTRSTVACPGP